MRVKIEKQEKAALLKALKDGFIETDNIPALKAVLDNSAPARILTKEEAKELIKQVENEC